MHSNTNTASLTLQPHYTLIKIYSSQIFLCPGLTWPGLTRDKIVKKDLPSLGSTFLHFLWSPLVIVIAILKCDVATDELFIFITLYYCCLFSLEKIVLLH